MGLFDNDLNIVVNYTYDSWGNVVSITGSLAETLGKDNPFRYRGYYFDNDTGLYYLNSRYYDSNTGRFINADGLVQTGQGLIDTNMFAYCGNNPINRFDSNGHCWESIKSYFNKTVNTFKKATNFAKNKFSVQHDVPLYNQGSTNLCWAYSQIMIEDSISKTSHTQDEVDELARQMGVSQHGENNWNSPGKPTNGGKIICNPSIYQIASIAYDGPVYARYKRGEATGHFVVITGVDLKNKTVTVNNPWGYSATMDYNDFLVGFPGSNETDGYTLDFVWDIS